MTRKVARRSRAARIPIAPAPPSRAPVALTAIELWYLQCFRLLAAHLKRPPSLPELATYCGRTTTPVYLALLRIEAKGVIRRGADRKFVEVAA